jgi:hypothetical protein
MIPDQALYPRIVGGLKEEEGVVHSKAFENPLESP